MSDGVSRIPFMLFPWSTLLLDCLRKCSRIGLVNLSGIQAGTGVGVGIITENIPFSYHADWRSAGRWGIEIMTTHQNAYRLIPMEQLYRRRKGSFSWELVETAVAFPGVKQGISEEIAIMLDVELEKKIQMQSIEKAAEYIALTEEIMGYASLKNGSH